MSFKVVWIACLLMGVASANCGGCCGCRNYKFFQIRRPNFLPMFETQSSCDAIYNDGDHVYEAPPLETIYPGETLHKLEPTVGRYLTPVIESRPLTCHKCICSKPSSSQRLVANVPRYYKRRYCNEPIVEALSVRPASASYRNPCCHQYDECGTCNQCEQCGQYGGCGCSSVVFRSSSPVLPLTLPASCIC